MRELKGLLIKDKYFKSNILNIYFDTENFDLIRKSIDKPVYNGIINKDSQIMKEIDYLFKYYKLVPKLFLAYNRESYKYKDRH